MGSDAIAKLKATEAIMAGIAAAIRQVLPGMGFALVVFDFNAPGIGNYVSNGYREDVVKTMREFADRLEEGAIVPAGGYDGQ